MPHLPASLAGIILAFAPLFVSAPDGTSWSFRSALSWFRDATPSRACYASPTAAKSVIS